MMYNLIKLSRLEKEYEDMKSMIYGEYPSFDEITIVIKNIEERINNK